MTVVDQLMQEFGDFTKFESLGSAHQGNGDSTKPKRNVSEKGMAGPPYLRAHGV